MPEAAPPGEAASADDPASPRETSEPPEPDSKRPVARPLARRRRFKVRRVATSVLSVYLLVCLVLYLVQGWLIYVPDRRYHATPRDADMPFEDLRLSTPDGETIAAWFVPTAGATRTVLLCHGNAGNMADRLIFMRQFQRFGYDVMAFDYRGFGRSTGRPDEHGTYLDAQTAWDYLVEQKGREPRDVIVWGESLGGAVAIDLASRHEPGLLIVECTFTSMGDVAADLLWMLPARLILRHDYDSIAKVTQIRCPKIFLHGRGDELIPFALGERLFAAAPEPKLFIPTDGGHVDGGMLYDYAVTQRVGELMAELAPARPGLP